MKNIFKILFLGAVFALALPSQSNAQAGGITKGGLKLQWRWPSAGVDSSTVMLFPTFTFSDPVYDDTLDYTITQQYTWVRCDTLTGNSLLQLTPGSGLTGGAMVFAQFGKDATGRTVYVKQGATAVDTIGVGNPNVKRFYIYNQSTGKFEVFK